MKGRSQITSGLMTLVLAAVMSGCGSSEPVPDEQATAMPDNPEGYQRGLQAVGEAQVLQETINARQVRAMNELERARESYSRALEIDSELSVAALKKGHINSFLGNFDEARADYDAGIADAQGANRPNYANYRTFTWLHAGDPDAALAALADLAESIDHMGLPDDQVRAATLFTLSNAAAVALHFDRLEAAERILARREEVAQISADTVGDPDYSRRVEAELVLWRGRLAAVAGDLDRARDLADRNRELLQGGSNPRRFEGHHGLLGRIALETGEFDEAVEQFQRADLTVTYVKYHLALALEGQDKKQDALRAVTKSLAAGKAFQDRDKAKALHKKLTGSN